MPMFWRTVLPPSSDTLNLFYLFRAGNFSLNHRLQTGSGAHLASYTMATVVSFPGGKVAGA
jgi:hypothetical protein